MQRGRRAVRQRDALPGSAHPVIVFMGSFQALGVAEPVDPPLHWGPLTKPEVRSMTTPSLSQLARRLARRPGYAAAAVLTLALGLGANLTIFSLVRGVLLR